MLFQKEFLIDFSVYRGNIMAWCLILTKRGGNYGRAFSADAFVGYSLYRTDHLWSEQTPAAWGRIGEGDTEFQGRNEGGINRRTGRKETKLKTIRHIRVV